MTKAHFADIARILAFAGDEGVPNDRISTTVPTTVPEAIRMDRWNPPIQPSLGEVYLAEFLVVSVSVIPDNFEGALRIFRQDN